MAWVQISAGGQVTGTHDRNPRANHEHSSSWVPSALPGGRLMLSLKSYKNRRKKEKEKWKEKEREERESKRETEREE